jgi:hypothetical protein
LFVRSDPSRPPRQHGRLPAPRARLRPAFYAEIIAAQFEDGTALPMSLIAKDCGFRFAQRLSNLLRAPDGVPITTRPLFERVARLIHYPADHIFIETADPTPRLVKKANADEARA